MAASMMIENNGMTNSLVVPMAAHVALAASLYVLLTIA